jgi:hypothetical protein
MSGMQGSMSSGGMPHSYPHGINGQTPPGVHHPNDPLSAMAAHSRAQFGYSPYGSPYQSHPAYLSHYPQHPSHRSNSPNSLEKAVKWEHEMYHSSMGNSMSDAMLYDGE